MRIFSIAVTFVILWFAVSCQSAQPVADRSASAASTAQDVVDAWDSLCDVYGFYPCPADVLESTCTETMGSMHKGLDFSIEAAAFMEAMSVELDSFRFNPVDDDDVLNAVINAAAWFN